MLESIIRSGIVVLVVVVVIIIASSCKEVGGQKSGPLEKGEGCEF